MKFPTIRCAISTIVITLVAVMVLALLFTIANETNIPDKAWIFAVVWGSLYLLGLAAYWIYQIRKFHKEKHKNEK